jgi:NTP pyrophosphatase (non-canonical NTP hydrolase)
MRSLLDTIKKNVPLEERLLGLAEEASELSQAALKYRRALTKKNPTPLSEDDAYENLLEEIADVTLYMDTLYINTGTVKEHYNRKLRRWNDRLMKETQK